MIMKNECKDVECDEYKENLNFFIRNINSFTYTDSASDLYLSYKF